MQAPSRAGLRCESHLGGRVIPTRTVEFKVKVAVALSSESLYIMANT